MTTQVEDGLVSSLIFKFQHDLLKLCKMNMKWTWAISLTTKLNKMQRSKYSKHSELCNYQTSRSDKTSPSKVAHEEDFLNMATQSFTSTIQAAYAFFFPVSHG